MMSARAWSATHTGQARLGLHPRRTNMTIRSTTTMLFWFWFALAAILVGFIATELRGTLTDSDRRAIELMLDGALPY